MVGGCGARLAQELRFAQVATPIREFGIPQEFLEHGSRSELLAEIGLTPQDIARYAVEAIAGVDDRLERPRPETQPPAAGTDGRAPAPIPLHDPGTG